ncbi:DUF58 domain-containing protein [Methanocella arvoryzae]|uniref:DUF58 domain-containing protein n=1 Tax=Methanocella arvoryzae (strain DSM 22066 / NBRC 105507 / MRE50) TaxID=351160 RepID=Q0W4E0_METAR|nr:DUF58 domain-containing protein [Methanocella arvoryzae]CAJ36753.1 hypothetical protein RCIX1489 [Methanocella arvoryzae MRE50]
MEVRDVSVVLVGAALAALAALAGGIVFYAALGAYALLLACDLFRLRSRASVLGKIAVDRKLAVSTIRFGSAVQFDTTISYPGHAELKIEFEQPLDARIASTAPLLGHVVFSGGQLPLLSTRLSPSGYGEFSIPPVTLGVSSWFFRHRVRAGTGLALTVQPGVTVPGTHTQASLRSASHYDSLYAGHVDRAPDGTDFSSLRNYAPGDSVRDIDWARSSRSGTLVVREFEKEWSPATYFLLDVDESMGTGEPSEFYAATSLVSSMISRLSVDNTRFGLICFSRDGIVKFLPATVGRGHILGARKLLATLKPVSPEKTAAGKTMAIYEASHLKSLLKDAQGLGIIGSVLEETLDDYRANIRAEGFTMAIGRITASAGSPCHIVVVTNLSMGVGCLMNGVRMATYHGHQVSVALTPHLWFGHEAESAEECYEKYREVKAAIRRIRGSGQVRVIDLSSSGENPEDALSRRMPVQAMRR